MNVFSNRDVIAPTREELWGGFVCFMAYLLVIPAVLSLCFPIFAEDTPHSLFLYNLTISVCCFLLTLILFRKFLFRSRLPFGLLFVTCLFGFLANRALENLLWLLLSFLQQFLKETPINLNQNTVSAFLNTYRGAMLVNVVILGPFVEEILFRGVIFGPLCKKNIFLAYVASMVAFAALHVISYIGVQHWSVLLFSALQYLPAGFVLCWSYQRSQSIWAPIVLHGLMNLFVSLLSMS